MRDTVLLFLFYFVSEFVTRKFQEYEEEIELNVTHLLLLHADEFHLSD